MLSVVIRKLVDLVDLSARKSTAAGLLVDDFGRLHVTGSGGVPPAPAAASSAGAAALSVGASEAALSGTSPSGFTLLNNSSGGQVIYLGDAGVTASTGFPLAVGAAIDRPSWQDLSVIHAVASAAGADLRVLPL